VGRLDASIQLFLRESGYGALALAAVVIGVELDPIGAVACLVAHRVDHLLDAADGNAALRDIYVGSKTHWAGTIAMRRDGGAGGDKQMRAGNQSLINRMLHIDVRVARAFGAQVAQGGKAGHQRVVHVLYRLNGAIG
jgi:hypothetical protein